MKYIKYLTFLLVIISFFLFTSCITITESILQVYDTFHASEYQTFKDITYGDDKNQNLDIYLPNGNTNEEMNLIVLVHGGSWISGDKSDFGYFAQWIMTNLENTTVSTINYRFLDDNVDFNDILEDVNSAVKKTVEFAENKNLKIKNMAMGGSSSGGQISLMYCYTKANQAPLPIKFCLALSSPSNLEDSFFLDVLYKKNFYGLNLFNLQEKRFEIVENLLDEDNVGDAIVKFPKISPVNYIKPESVPTIVAHGEKDNVVPSSNSLYLVEVLFENEISYDFKIFKGVKHHLRENKEANSWIKESLIKYSQKYF
ncbi:MAG: prolyl oligopeptidase family serine peptidase [Sphaerochaetaceae bacterium]|nr:prolyl oligopeptidase family serine peptidase [Sphaerochaetaceae bacterium]